MTTDIEPQSSDLDYLNSDDESEDDADVLGATPIQPLILDDPLLRAAG
jgi:hypothetical protein